MSVLSSVVDRVSANPLLGFVPHGGQECFLGGLPGLGGGLVGSRFYLGGNRSGKSTVGVVDDLVQCLPVEFVPSWLVGFKRRGVSRVRCVAPSLKDQVLGVLVPKFREWCPAAALVGGSFDSAFDRQRYVLRFVNGSEVQFMSYDMDLGKFGGVDLDQVHFDEEPPEDIRTECFKRLWDRGGHEVFTMTPQWSLSWVLDFLEERSGSGSVCLVRSSTLDNPHISREAVLADMEGMSDLEVRVRVFGEFAHLEGLVFGEFDRGVHVVSAPGVGGDVVVGIDPGARWAAAVFVCFDSENRATVFDEVFLEGSVERSVTVPDLAAAIRGRCDFWGVDPFFVIDPSARNRNLVDGRSVLDALVREGVPVAGANNRLSASVLEVKRRLGSGGLVISDRCERLLWELGRYRNDPAAGPGEVRPLRKDNHAVDGLRYAVMARPSVLPSVARSVRRGVPVAGEDVSWGPPRRVRGVSSVGEFL